MAVRRSVTAGAIAIMLVGAPCAAQGLEAAQASDSRPADAAGLTAELERPDADATTRRTAATRLLNLASRDLAALDALDRAIAGPIESGSPGGAVVFAIAAAEDPPMALLRSLEDRASSEAASPEECVMLLGAMASFRSLQGARTLVRFASPDRPRIVVEASMAALSTLTGRLDLPRDHAWLEAWWRSQEEAGELQWQRTLSNHLARRVAREQADAAILTGRLIDSVRRLHLMTPADKRPALLVELMKDPQPAVRDLGFELAARELANNGSIDASVGAAAIELLASPDAFARGQAALLVRQIAPPNAAEAVSAALARETEPSVASDLLLAATRWPTPASISAVLSWLARGEGVRQAAIEACLQITRTVTIANADRDVMLATVRGIPRREYTPAAATLLAEQGDEQDRLGLVPLLHEGVISVRLAVAEALLWHEEHEQAIIEAAEKTPELVPAAAKAVMVHGARSQNVIRVMRARAATPDTSRAAVAMLASTTPAPDLLAVVEACTDPSIRSILLASLASPSRVLSERADPAALDAIVKGVVMAAEEDLSLGDAASALAVLDGAPFLDGSPMATRAASLRVISLLATGKVEQARGFDAPADAWLRGFDLARGTSAGATVAAAVLERFDSQLGPADRDRLLAAVAAEAFVGPPPSK